MNSKMNLKKSLKTKTKKNLTTKPKTAKIKLKALKTFYIP